MSVIHVLLHVVQFHLVLLHDRFLVHVLVSFRIRAVLVLHIRYHQSHMFQSQIGVLHSILRMIPAIGRSVSRVRVCSGSLSVLLRLLLVLERLLIQFPLL